MSKFGSFTVQEAAAVVADFESYLASFGASPKPSSQLKQSVALARGLPAMFESGKYPPGENPLTVDAPAMAATALACQVLRARGTPLEPSLRTRLKAMSKGVHLPLPSSASSSARNSVLETIAACALGTFATNVDFAEPDVTCEFESSRWGVAAKVAYGSPDAVADLIDEGRRQVEKQFAAQKIEKGVVLLDLTTLMPQLLRPHPTEQGKWMSFMTIADVEHVLHAEHDSMLSRVLERITPPRENEPTIAIMSITYRMARVRGVPTIARISIGRDLPQVETRPSGLVVLSFDENRRFLNRLVDGLRIGK